MEPHKIAGQRIARLRGPMSQPEFGRRMGELGFPMSRQTVWKIEDGHRPLTLDELFAAAYVLGVSPFTLLLPDEDEAIHVGQLAVGRKVFIPWWLHLDHPNPEAVDDRFIETMPEVVRTAMAGKSDTRAFDDAGWSLIYAAAAALRDGDEEAALQAGRAMAALVSNLRTKVSRVAIAAQDGTDAELLDALREVIDTALDPDMVEQYDRQAANNQARAAIKRFQQLGLGNPDDEKGNR